MRLNITLFFLLLLSCTANAQKITGIWRGYFSSTNGQMRNGYPEEHYKYEVQINQLSNNGVRGVTFSYKTTVFYGKAELSGIYNATSKSLIIKETKLVDLKVGDNSEPCLMTCYLDYTKMGKLEILEGTFISINVKDKGDCGSGKVYLERVATSDFKKEDFLVKKKANSLNPNRQADASTKPGLKLPPSVSPEKKDNTTSKGIPKKLTAPIQKPKAKVATVVPKTNPPPAKKQSENTTSKKKPLVHDDRPVVVPRPVDRIPEEIVNSNKHEEKEIQGTENTFKKIDIPKVLLERENHLVKTITTSEENIQIEFYDNGTIDNDTISVYHNNQLVVSNGRLSYSPITIKIKCSKTDNRHEMIVVAENLGDIPPNTALMVIKGGTKERYEIFLASTEQSNAKVIINYVPKE